MACRRSPASRCVIEAGRHDALARNAFTTSSGSAEVARSYSLGIAAHQNVGSQPPSAPPVPGVRKRSMPPAPHPEASCAQPTFCTACPPPINLSDEKPESFSTHEVRPFRKNSFAFAARFAK
jgi:hypothetical protein